METRKQGNNEIMKSRTQGIYLTNVDFFHINNNSIIYMPSCDINKSTSLLQKFIYIIIFVGVIVAITGSYIQSTSLDNQNANTTALIGNALSVIGLFTLIPLIMAINKKCQGENTTPSGVLYDFIIQPGPSIITIIVIIYNAIINQVYKNSLISHNVSPEYYRYALLFSILLIVQLIFLGKYLIGSTDAESVFQYVVYLLGSLNLILLSIMQIILKFFSTDG